MENEIIKLVIKSGAHLRPLTTLLLVRRLVRVCVQVCFGTCVYGSQLNPSTPFSFIRLYSAACIHYITLLRVYIPPL